MVPTPANVPQDQPTDIPIDLFTAARRLQHVRTACRRFLLLWAMSPAKAREDLALDQVLKETDGQTQYDAEEDPEALLRAMSNPADCDWSLLYRGSVLDD